MNNHDHRGAVDVIPYPPVAGSHGRSIWVSAALHPSLAGKWVPAYWRNYNLRFESAMRMNKAHNMRSLLYLHCFAAFLTILRKTSRAFCYSVPCFSVAFVIMTISDLQEKLEIFKPTMHFTLCMMSHSVIDFFCFFFNFLSADPTRPNNF